MYLDWSKIDMLTMILPSVKWTNNLLHIRIVAFQASGEFCRPLLTVTNSLDPYHARQTSSKTMPDKLHDRSFTLLVVKQKCFI